MFYLNMTYSTNQMPVCVNTFASLYKPIYNVPVHKHVRIIMYIHASGLLPCVNGFYGCKLYSLKWQITQWGISVKPGLWTRLDSWSGIWTVLFFFQFCSKHHVYSRFNTCVQERGTPEPAMACCLHSLFKVVFDLYSVHVELPPPIALIHLRNCRRNARVYGDGNFHHYSILSRFTHSIGWLRSNSLTKIKRLLKFKVHQ